MPASHERVPNRPLSGTELTTLVERDVHDILSRDGMFTQNIAFGRISYEVRVTLHLDNPVYPEHVATILSRPASKQQIERNPELGTIEPYPLEETGDKEIVFSEQRNREIASPNMARVEHDLPIVVEKRNLDTGQFDQVPMTYKGDKPDPAEVGNTSSDINTVSSAIEDIKKRRKK